MGEGRPHSPPLITADAVGPVSTPSRAGDGPRHAALRVVMEVCGAVNMLPSKSVWLGAPRTTTRPKWGSWSSCGATGECGALHGQSTTLRPAWRRVGETAAEDVGRVRLRSDGPVTDDTDSTGALPEAMAGGHSMGPPSTTDRRLARGPWLLGAWAEVIGAWAKGDEDGQGWPR